MRRIKQNTDKNFAGEDKTAMSAAACLNRIFRKVDNEGLSEDAITGLEEDLKSVAVRFSISPRAAVILAAVLEHNGSRGGVNDEGLAMYLGCTNIEFIGFHDCLKELTGRGIVSESAGCSGGYEVTAEALKAVEEDSEFVPVAKSGLTADEFFSRIRGEVKSLKRGVIDCDRFLEDIDYLVDNNQQLEYCRKVRESELFGRCTPTERRIFYYLSHRYVSAGEQQVDVDILMNLTDIMEDDSRLKRYISLERTHMQTSGLVTFGNSEGFSDGGSLALAEKVLSTFFQEVELAPAPEKKHRDMVCSASIKAKDLFYNVRETEQIGRLDSLLGEENFRGVQSRLEEKGMRKGFNVIFYGGPGTGKTACAYEIARRTGRDIFCVDMSGLKSKWVGDSEKNVKGIFTTYREMVHRNKVCPILLFNEADTIFSRRIRDVGDSVDQMMNSIQNIILQEMEDMEGILIATTNIAENLDPAFERRFIFKIRFDQPGKEVRKKIWQSMIPDISAAEAERLADDFVSFSGGNIENISRKSDIDYVLSGRRPTYDTLVKYCSEEMLSGTGGRHSIGF